jgi:hypothetical protein
VAAVDDPVPESARARPTDLRAADPAPRALPSDAGRRRLRNLAVAVACAGGVVLYARIVHRFYRIGDWLFWRYALLWGYAALVSLACLASGLAVLERLFRPARQPLGERLVTSVAVGYLLLVLASYALGFLGLFGRWSSMALLAGLSALGARPLAALYRRWRRARALAAPERPSWRTTCARVATLAGALGILVVYLQAMTPHALNFDALWYHLPIAQDYAREGRIVPFLADYNRALPHAASLLQTHSFLLPGMATEARWALALHHEFAFFLWTLVGIAALVRWIVGRRVRAAWAAMFLFPAIFVYDHNLGGAADHFLAFLGPPFVLALARALGRLEPRRCALVGALGAAALLTKYQAVYFLAPAALALAGRWLQLVLRRAAGGPVHLARGPLLTLALLVGLASPHFVKNVAYYRSPVYPFAAAIFGPGSPAEGDATLLAAHVNHDPQFQPTGTWWRRAVGAAARSFSFSFVARYSFTGNVPCVGSLFTLLLPVAPFVRGRRRLGLVIALAFGALLVWAATYFVDRYLQIIVPLMAAATAVLIVRGWELGLAPRVGIGALVAFQLVWGADALVYSGHERIERAVDLIRAGHAGRAAQRMTVPSEGIAIGSSLPRDAVVLLHSDRVSLGIDRRILLDIPGAQGLISYQGIDGPRALYERLRALGVTHLVHPARRRPSHVMKDNVLFHELVHRHASERSDVRGHVRTTLPEEPPPPDGRYLVLVVGVHRYRDGLYGVEQLGQHGGLPEGVWRPEAPIEPLGDRSADAIKRLMVRADAAVTRAVPPEIMSLLRRRFELGERFDREGISIHLLPRRGPRP